MNGVAVVMAPPRNRAWARRRESDRATERAFLAVAAALFVAAAAVTVVWCGSMSAMGGMRMPGGWTMSMAWMRMPGQSWPGAAASFVAMWVVMMVAMMLPALAPMLRHYRAAVGATADARLDELTALVGVGYFFVWTVLGMAVFPVGVALSAIAMREPALARLIPIAIGCSCCSRARSSSPPGRRVISPVVGRRRGPAGGSRPTCIPRGDTAYASDSIAAAVAPVS